MNNHFFAKPDFADNILFWYDTHARTLPWRSLPGETPDAYHIWLSEIMLQQTTVATVGPYFKKFLANWPTVQQLAAAPLDDVLAAWAGLGYYARARNLHKCAGAVCQQYGGVFPSNEAALRALPGIGDYTAAAITAIAHGMAAVVVDGNIERIISRIFRVEEELPKARKRLRELAAIVSPAERSGDYAQALMDIGATVCTPKKPDCAACPVSSVCAALEKGDPSGYPRKAPKKVKPVRRGVVLWIENSAGDVLMRRRIESGLLGGMMEFPSTEWITGPLEGDPSRALLKDLGLTARRLSAVGKGMVKHTFTHFHLELSPLFIALEQGDQMLSNEMQWIHPDQFGRIALPTLMKKVVQAAQEKQ